MLSLLERKSPISDGEQLERTLDVPSFIHSKRKKHPRHLPAVSAALFIATGVVVLVGVGE